MLMISDGAAYMVKAGETLKVLYAILEHVLCTVHGLHRVCKEVMDEYPLVNNWLAYLKKVVKQLNFSHNNYQYYHL